MSWSLVKLRPIIFFWSWLTHQYLVLPLRVSAWTRQWRMRRGWTLWLGIKMHHEFLLTDNIWLGSREQIRLGSPKSLKPIPLLWQRWVAGCYFYIRSAGFSIPLWRQNDLIVTWAQCGCCQLKHFWVSQTDDWRYTCCLQINYVIKDEALALRGLSKCRMQTIHHLGQWPQEIRKSHPMILKAKLDIEKSMKFWMVWNLFPPQFL